MGMQAFAVAEGDLPTLADVHADAFDGSTLNRLMSPKGYTPRAREVMIGTLQQQMKDPSTHLIKAVDNETGEIAGFARWNIYPSGRSDEELNEPKPPRPEDPDINVELRNIAVDILEKTRRETMGKRPHCSLNLLAVSPKFQRRGVGALLVQYGLDIADRDAMESYLESTKQGYKLYTGLGFEDRSMIKVEVSKWSGVEDEVLTYPVMIRPIRRKGNLPN